MNELNIARFEFGIQESIFDKGTPWEGNYVGINDEWCILVTGPTNQSVWYVTLWNWVNNDEVEVELYSTSVQEVVEEGAKLLLKAFEAKFAPKMAA